MTRIWVVAVNTLRETIRQRLFYNVLLFGVGMVFLGMVIGQLTFGYPDRVVRSIGLSGVTLAMDIIALLTGVGLIHGEIDRKTLFVLLTRPLRRWEYVVGRYLGLAIALALALVGLSVIFALILIGVGGVLGVDDFFALAAVLPEAAVLGGVGIALSAFSTPMLGAGMGIGLWIASATTDDLVRLTVDADPLLRNLCKVIFYVLPSLARFNYRDAAVYGLSVDPAMYAMSFAYGLGYAAFLAVLASLILSRREMI